MSERTAKATRRDLRRAMGMEAATFVQSQATVLGQEVIPQISSLVDRERMMSVELLHQSAKITAIQQGLKDKAERYRTLTGRLRWLLTGR